MKTTNLYRAQEWENGDTGIPCLILKIVKMKYNRKKKKKKEKYGDADWSPITRVLDAQRPHVDRPC